ncbi:unnamed protein product, partial [Medioppia subpectinata]
WFVVSIGFRRSPWVERSNLSSDSLAITSPEIVSQLSSLQKLVNQLGSSEDTISFRNQFIELNRQKERKILCERIRSDFLDILNKFQETQRIAAQRVKEFTVKHTKHERNASNPIFGTEEFDFESTTLSFKEETFGPTQTQMVEMENERNNLELAQQQHESVKRLESDIQDVNQIFQELAKMVYEQQEVVDHIETNVVSAQIQVEGGNQQLRTAAEYQRKARKKRLWIIIIFVIILVILTLIIYFSVKK